MANSTLTQFPAGQSQYKINFDYLARSFVVVTLMNSTNATLNKVLTVGNDYRFLNATTVEILADQSGFNILQIHRFTSSELLVGFQNGSVLTASDLTTSELQAIHIAEEGRDYTLNATQVLVDAAKIYADEAEASANEAATILGEVQEAITNNPEGLTAMVQLGRPTGASLIGTENGMNLQEVIDSRETVRINIRDRRWAGGAKGDWNQTTKTGTDDTAAFQAAIDYLATLPTMRNAGARLIDLGSGQYYVKGVVVPQSFGFGFGMVGDGFTSCGLYLDITGTDKTAGILMQCEFNLFRGIRLIGAASDNESDLSKRCDVLTVKLEDMRADCDLIVDECAFHAHDAAVKLYGRGLQLDACMFGNGSSVLHIVADIAQKWPGNNDQQNGIKSGMRNYRINGIRTDYVTSIVEVSGTGPQKDYINGVSLNNIDSLGTNQILLNPDSTLRNLSISGFSGQESCAFGLFKGKAVNGAVLTNIVTSKSITRDEVITGGNPTMQGLFTMTGALDNIVLDGADLGPIRNSFIIVGAESSNITLTNLTLHRLFSAAPESASNLVLVSGANVKGFNASNWNVTGPGPAAGKNVLCCVPTVQTSNRFSMKNINSNFLIQTAPVRTPNVVFGSTLTTPTLAFYEVEYHGQTATIRGCVTVTNAGAPANNALGIATGLACRAKWPAQTSSVSGGGMVQWQMASPASAMVNAITCVVTAGGTIQFFKANGGPLTSTDLGTSTNVHSLQFEVNVAINPETFV